MSASHYNNHLACGHRSWLSTTRPNEFERCWPCDATVAVLSEKVGGLAHPERVIRDPGKFALKTPVGGE